MKVFLCEKPSQGAQLAAALGARTRGDGVYRGDGIAVTWCIGHLLEQAAPEKYGEQFSRWELQTLPILPDPWQLEVKSSVKSQFNVVKSQLKQATEVVIATDADREGEVIAREIMDLVGYRGKISRLWLTTMDPASVKRGLSQLKPESSTRHLYHSGLGRSRADWLMGMNITRALTTAFAGGGKGNVLHCGRVQTAVLGLVVRRERQIQNFKAKPYFVLDARFEIMGTVVPMDWMAPEIVLDKDGHCVDPAVIDAVVSKISGKVGRVTNVSAEPSKESAPLPYYLGEIQKEANRRFGMKPQQVLDACQSLYETHKATSYPRTDCGYLMDEMWDEVPSVLQALVDVDPSMKPLVSATKLDQKPRCFNSSKCTAHHGIVPTAYSQVKLAAMSNTERSIYELIRRRYIAQFLGDHLFTKTVIEVSCEGESFSKSGRTTTFAGWKRAELSVADSTGKAEDQAVILPSCKPGDQAIVTQAAKLAKKTEPPKRYTDGTLVAAMEAIDKEIDDPRFKAVMKSKEKAGIGTEATRAAIIDGLYKRGYIGNEKKSIIPTDRGTQLVLLLEKMVPQLVDPVLTAHWEEQLSQVEAGNLQLHQFEGSIAKWLGGIIEEIRDKAGTAQIVGAEPTGKPTTKPAPKPPAGAQKCPSCGEGHMVQRNSAKGLFWGCSAYPKCRHSMADQDGAPVAKAAGAGKAATGNLAGQVCPTCGKGKLQLRNLKDSSKQFWGCSEYQNGCRHFVWATP
jgi:DNA topoisomerase III